MIPLVVQRGNLMQLRTGELIRRVTTALFCLRGRLLLFCFLEVVCSWYLYYDPHLNEILSRWTGGYPIIFVQLILIWVVFFVNSIVRGLIQVGGTQIDLVWMLENESGPPRINLAMFPQTAHASSIKLGLLMTLNLPGCVYKWENALEKNLIDCFANDLNSFSKPLWTKKQTIYFSYHQPLFSFLPACVDMRKINLGVGVLVQDPMIVMALNLTGWHSQVRRCVWNRILLIARDESWKPLFVQKKLHKQIHTQSISFCATKFFFSPARVATRKINLGVGVLVQDPMIVMALNLTGWHSQVRRCVWNRILLIVRDESWKPV